MPWKFYDRRIDFNAKRLPSHFYIKCDKCGAVFGVYTWSFAGSGKKCPKCKTVHYLSELWNKPIYQ